MTTFIMPIFILPLLLRFLLLFIYCDLCDLCMAPRWDCYLIFHFPPGLTTSVARAFVWPDHLGHRSSMLEMAAAALLGGVFARCVV